MPIAAVRHSPASPLRVSTSETRSAAVLRGLEHTLGPLGPEPAGAAPNLLASVHTSERSYATLSTLASSDNLVSPLFPNSLVSEGEGNYDEAMRQAIRDAPDFVVVEGYMLDRQDLVDMLLEKARAGVEVLVLFDPADEPAEKTKADLLQQLRDAKLPHLHVVEYRVLEPRKGEYPQILHVKKIIAGRPGGSVVEVSGGINFRTHSLNNFDTGWRLEGVSALDSLRFILEHYLRSSNDLSFDASRIPSEEQVRARVQQIAAEQKRKLVRVEIGAAGRFEVRVPTKFSRAELERRIADRQSVAISVSNAMQEGVDVLLEKALTAGCSVTLVPGSETSTEREAWKPTEMRLKNKGALLLKSNVIVDRSYAHLILTELDKSIAAKESIDISAYALSSKEVLDKVIFAKKAGCKVRVLVDDEKIGGVIINQKAMALAANAGIPTKVVNQEAKEKLAALAGPGVDSLKLHSKVIILGGNRVLAGSANFSQNGLYNNVEDGRLIESKEVAQAYLKILFNPLWKVATEVRPTIRVPAASRVPLLDCPKLSTKVEDAVFVVFDTETTGFMASHDDRILSVAAQAVQFKPDGTLQVLDEYKALVSPGTNVLGQPFKIPSMIARVTGLTTESLKKDGARGIREVVPEFVDFIQRQQATGPVVLAGQNVSFDVRFMDDVLSKKGITASVNHRMDTLWVDTAELGKKVRPGKKRYSLDDLMTMLDIPLDDAHQRHQAMGDVVYASRALHALVKEGKFKTLRDLLGEDQLDFTHPTNILEKPNAQASSHFRLQQSKSKSTVLTSRDHVNGSFIRPVSAAKVAIDGVENNLLEVTVDAGRGGDAIHVEGYIDPVKAQFRRPGPAYYTLQEAGVPLKTPKIVQA